MKKLLPLVILPAGLVFCQARFVSNELVVSNLSKDTVYIKKDPTGMNIYQSWLMDPYYDGKKVTPILVDDLAAYHQRYEMLAVCNNTEPKKKKRSKKQ